MADLKNRTPLTRPSIKPIYTYLSIQIKGYKQVLEKFKAGKYVYWEDIRADVQRIVLWESSTEGKKAQGCTDNPSQDIQAGIGQCFNRFIQDLELLQSSFQSEGSAPKFGVNSNGIQSNNGDLGNFNKNVKTQDHHNNSHQDDRNNQNSTLNSNDDYDRLRQRLTAQKENKGQVCNYSLEGQNPYPKQAIIPQNKGGSQMQLEHIQAVFDQRPKMTLREEQLWQKLPLKFQKMCSLQNSHFALFKLFFNMEDPQSMEVEDHTLINIELKRKDRYHKDLQAFRNTQNNMSEFKSSLRMNPFAQKIDNPFKNQFFVCRADRFLRTFKRQFIIDQEKDMVDPDTALSYFQKNGPYFKDCYLKQMLAYKKMYLNALRYGVGQKCELQCKGLWKTCDIISYQCVRCFQYFENCTYIKIHINKHHMNEKEQLWSSGRIYLNEIVEDQTPYKFLRSNEFNPHNNSIGGQYVCLCGCPIQMEAHKQLTTGKDIREHYIKYHSFEELKLWGYNRELLKQELGMKDSNYQKQYVQKYDINDTFRGIEVNEREYALQEKELRTQQEIQQQLEREKTMLTKSNVYPASKTYEEEQLLNQESFEQQLLGNSAFSKTNEMDQQEKYIDVEEREPPQYEQQQPPINNLQNDQAQQTKRLQRSIHTLGGVDRNDINDPANNTFNDLKEPPAFVPERLSRMSRYDGPQQHKPTFNNFDPSDEVENEPEEHTMPDVDAPDNHNPMTKQFDHFNGNYVVQKIDNIHKDPGSPTENIQEISMNQNNREESEENYDICQTLNGSKKQFRLNTQIAEPTESLTPLDADKFEDEPADSEL